MAYTNDIGIRDFYNLYKDNAIKKNRSYETYQSFAKIIKLFNSKLRDKIVYESEKIRLPYRLGELYIHKFENTYTEENKLNWRVDYKASKEANTTIYHGAKYGYRWKWIKKECLVKGKRWFQFKPCRKASRLIADAVLNKNLDYYN